MQTVYACGGGVGGSQQREVADGADVVFTDTARRRLRVICEMRIAKLRKGNLRNRLRNALWLVGRN